MRTPLFPPSLGLLGPEPPALPPAWLTTGLPCWTSRPGRVNMDRVGALWATMAPPRPHLHCHLLRGHSLAWLMVAHPLDQLLSLASRLLPRFLPFASLPPPPHLSTHFLSVLTASNSVATSSMPLLQSLLDAGSFGCSVRGVATSSAALSPGPAHRARGRTDVAKGMNRGGGPSTLTQLCWPWGSGPLPRRIPGRPSVRVPGPSAPWQQRPRCTVGGGGTGEKKPLLP